LQSKNLPWTVGLATFVVTSVLFMILSKNVLASGLIGVLAAGVLATATHFAFPPDDALDAYNIKARRGVAKLLDSVKEIQKLANRVKDTDARQALESGCNRIPDLIAKVQERDATGVASMAATLNVTVSGIQSSLGRYLDIQKDPSLYTDGPKLLEKGTQGFKDFDGFVVRTFRTVNDADVIEYNSTLAAIKPLEIPQLT
jgi:hypothetical protein